MKHFKGHHDQLRAMSRAYPAATGEQQKPDIHTILQQRKTFSAAFQIHFAAEQDALASLRTGAQGDEARELEACSRRMRELAMRHSQLVREWPPKRIDAEWTAYCKVFREQREYFLAHLDWEEKVLHPTLQRAAAAQAGGKRRA